MFSACVFSHSVVSDSATPWTVAHQAPLSMGFPRHEYWSGLPFLILGYLPDPGIEPASPMSPALQVDSLSTEPCGDSGFLGFMSWFLLSLCLSTPAVGSEIGSQQ